METTQKQHTSPKDFFINLGVIGLLYFLIINTITLLFSSIDVAFPKTIDASYYIPDISFPLAALIVGFPLFLALSALLRKSETVDSSKKDLPVRKWLTYLTLFVAGLVALGDLIYLLSTFLRGEEITTGFVLKVLILFVLAGITFAYYLLDVRYQGGLPIHKIFAGVASFFVVASIVFGFSTFGSPATQKAKRFDAERISGLQSIQYQVLDYWQTKKTVPSNLSDLSDPIRGFSIPRDPKTDASYEYEKLSTTNFRLCAVFERAGGTYEGVSGAETAPVVVGMGGISEYWGHDAGRVCFDRTIDPERYPVLKTQVW